MTVEEQTRGEKVRLPSNNQERDLVERMGIRVSESRLPPLRRPSISESLALDVVYDRELPVVRRYTCLATGLRPRPLLFQFVGAARHEGPCGIAVRVIG